MWVKQAPIDFGNAPGVTSVEQARMKELEREVRDLDEANEILKAASTFFAREIEIALALEHVDVNCGSPQPGRRKVRSG